MDTLDPASLPHTKFGVGQSVSRKEDPRLLTGGGRYTDDLVLERQTYAAILRSPYAHAELRGIDTGPALALAGVIAVYTGADMKAAGYNPLPCPLPFKSHDGTPLIVPDRHALAIGRVRYAGEAIALVVAESRAAAKDGAEAIELDVKSLPAVTDLEEAIGPDAPRIHDEAPGNVALDWRYGDQEAIAEAFKTAAHVTRIKLANSRIVVASLEPRGAVAEWDDRRERFTLHVGCQGTFGLAASLAKGIMNLEAGKLRVRSYDIGGSFGMKAPAYPEYVPLLHAARALGRPVKWIDERTESFVSDYHGRHAQVDAALALDAEGNFLAVTIEGLGSLGAYVAGFGPAIPCINIVKNTVSLYKTPLIGVSTRCVLTNTTPVSAFRGAGRPEANYYMERLVEAAARETGRDPVALRRQNAIPADAMPWQAASGLEYDSGEFEAVLDKCLDRADWDGFDARRKASEAAGKLRGRGIGFYLEVTAPPAKEMGGIRFEPNGDVTIVTGTLDYGQGHRSTFAQILCDKLGVPFERVQLIQGDSDELLAGGGTGGSRSVMASGTAILTASDEVIEQGRAFAGHFLEAAVADIEFGNGAFRVAGTDRAIGIMDLAARIREAGPLPDDLPASLDAELVVDSPPSAFPNGCHIAEIEIDAETGVAKVVRYAVVDDFGVLVNPMLVEAQVHGGVVQGIGQALGERVVYDEGGNLASGSFMDYALPRADELPSFSFGSHEVPAATNPLGSKGCGEGGTSGALPAVMNAVNDALASRDVAAIDMPATPERVWRALNGG
ncbi:MAG TPA: xanthine dehydrogenase family protein molybdopterin-binding subunit [Alphaproteobacteria bacterium]|nr:xanthine dehydrogenase family protein molybdopterin-binding subunit [Alphaproteobacteria bacterium]